MMKNFVAALSAVALLAATAPMTDASAQSSRARAVAIKFAESVPDGSTNPLKDYSDNRGRCIRSQTPACQMMPNLPQCTPVSPSIPCDGPPGAGRGPREGSRSADIPGRGGNPFRVGGRG